MPKVDWDDIEDAKGLLPDGTYLMRVDSCDETVSTTGNEMWNLVLVVAEGSFAGFQVRDRLVFANPKSWSRVKHVCKELGLATTGVMDLRPNLLIGKMARVKVEQESYDKPEGGKGRTVKVPFAGYESLAPKPGPNGEPTSDDDIPF